MITTTGKSIIAKYLIDQAPSYASYIAVGCGLNPETTSYTINNRALSGTSMILTTTANHSILEGDRVFISGLGPLFDGSRIVASVTSNTITITTTAIPATTAIVHSTPSAGFATATTGTTAHGLSVGDVITITATTEFNNTDIVISATTSTTFTFPDASTTNGADVAGTVSIDAPHSGTVNLDFSVKQNLDFEMFRVPIISRSYGIDENGVSQIIFSGELPTQERYYMTEAGVFSAGSNPIAVASDSRMLHTFSSIENWEYHDSIGTAAIVSPSNGIAPAATYGGTSYPISAVISPNLDAPLASGVIPRSFLIDNTDGIFSSIDRTALQHREQPRMLKNSIAVFGNMSSINRAATTWTATDQPHIHLTNQTYPMDINSSSDEMVLAFSIIKRYAGDSDPTNVYIMVEFSSEENDANQAYAKMQIELSSTDFSTNNGYYYFVKRKTLSDLLKSSNFTWENVKIAKVYTQAVPATRSISNKALTGNVATITTSAAHYVAVGDTITVAGVDATFNGTYTVTAINESARTISYSKTATNVGTTAVSPAGTLTRDGQSIFIALDGLRFENNFDMDANPLYGMTAYSPIKNIDGEPALKDVNSKNLIDIKINLGLTAGA
jgi:hypothetical protein